MAGGVSEVGLARDELGSRSRIFSWKLIADQGIEGVDPIMLQSRGAVDKALPVGQGASDA